MARSILLHVIGTVSILVFSVFTLLTFVAVPIQLVALPWDRHRAAAAWVTRWTWGVLHFLCQPFWRVLVTGRERAVGPGRVIVANHQSMLDIPLLMLLPVPIRVSARPGVFRMPVYGTMAAFGNHPVIEPGGDLEPMIGLLRAGIHVVVFPEGTRSLGGEMLPFHRGAFELAVRAGAEVLPVVIRGTADALPRDTPFPREYLPRIHAQVLPPIPSAGADRRGLARDVRAAMEVAHAGPDPFAVSVAVGARYRRCGRFASGFARSKTRHDPLYWAAWERLPREGLVVDLGCGEGLLGAYLRACGSKVRIWGVDVDEARVGRARATAEAADHHEAGDVRSVVLPEQAAAVVAFDVLHYLPPAAQADLVDRMVAALAPGGVLLVRDPEVGRGLAGLWTRASERLMVAIGRHRGQDVRVQGSAALVARLGTLVDVRVEDCSTGPFANVLVRGSRG